MRHGGGGQCARERLRAVTPPIEKKDNRAKDTSLFTHTPQRHYHKTTGLFRICSRVHTHKLRPHLTPMATYVVKYEKKKKKGRNS